MGSDLTGGKGGEAPENPMSNVAAYIASNLYGLTDKMRQGIVSQGNDFISNNFDPTKVPGYWPARNAVEDQYNVARQNTIANMPRGGALLDNLTDVETSRARALSDIAGNMSADQYNKIYGLATLTPQQSIGTLSSLANTYAYQQSQQNAQDAAKAGESGQAIGQIIGMMAK